jgi:hypothetical protein
LLHATPSILNFPAGNVPPPSASTAGIQATGFAQCGANQRFLACEMRFARRSNISACPARWLLDAPVQVHETPAELLREQFSDCGFAAAQKPLKRHKRQADVCQQVTHWSSRNGVERLATIASPDPAP